MKKFINVAALSVVFALSACGSGSPSKSGNGGDGGSGDNGGLSAPSAPVVNVSVSPKTFTFDWEPVSDALFYRVYANDGSGFYQVGDDLDKDTTEFTVNVDSIEYNPNINSYIFEACNNKGCSTTYSFPTQEQVIQSIQKIEAPEGVSRFGASVSMSADGNTLVVGANRGRVFVYERTENGFAMTYDYTILTGSDIDQVTYYQDISANGNVFAYMGKTNSRFFVKIFKRSLIGWVEHYTKVFSENIYIDMNQSGVKISPDGKQIYVSNPDRNSVIIFNEESSSYSMTTINRPTSARFGQKIVISGNGKVMAVSAPNHMDLNGNSSIGAIHIYKKDTYGNWVYSSMIANPYERLNASYSAPNYGARFAESMSLNYEGNKLAVGASDYSRVFGFDTNQPKVGAVFLFSEGSPNFWFEVVHRAYNPTNDLDFFGYNVAINAEGNRILALAPNEDSASVGFDGDIYNNDASNSGALWVLEPEGLNLNWKKFIKTPELVIAEGSQYSNINMAASADLSSVAVAYNRRSLANSTDNTFKGVIFVY